MNEMERLFNESKRVKALYPAGTRICLNNMDDKYAPVPAGTRGTVVHVDDAGQIHMAWDNGRTLALVPGVDSFRKLTAYELDDEKKGIQCSYSLLIRRYGRALDFNSLDELKDELKRYFSPRELASGIVERLTEFGRKNDDGYYRNTFQDYEVCCYEHELAVSVKKPSLDDKIKTVSERSVKVQAEGRGIVSEQEL